MKLHALARGALRLPRSDRRRALAAAAALAYARLALALLPFAKAIRIGSVALGPKTEPQDDAVAKWVSAVTRASYVAPWRAVCIHQGLALQRLLRRRGVAAVLCYGTAQLDGELKSHVWVTVGERTVIGGDQAPQYKLLAAYPAAPAGD